MHNDLTKANVNAWHVWWMYESNGSGCVIDTSKSGPSLASGSLQTNCNWERLSQQGHVRLGIVGDESVGCGTFPSPDSFIGFGAIPGFGSPCGNTAHWSPDNGDRDTKVFGYVMVR